jgi:hypothetical protein
MLARIVKASPSSFAAPIGDKSWKQMHDELGVKFHRPTEESSGIHVSLMSECLAHLEINLRNVQLDRKDYEFTVRFCRAMCGVFSVENERRLLGNQMLSEYFNESISPILGQSEHWKIDGAFKTRCGSLENNIAVPLIIEYKNELGLSTPPFEQAIGYYLKSVMESNFARERSVCPALLMVIAGPNLSVLGAVHGAGSCVDPLVPLLPTLILKQDIVMMTSVARTLKACKVCIQELKQCYNNMNDNEMDDIEQLKYPYPCSFMINDSKFFFKYDNQIGDKLVFLAHLTGTYPQIVANDIIIKYTRNYFRDAHTLCYSINESAPKLYAHSELPSGWHMLVMERVEGNYFKERQESPENKQRLINVIQELHQANFVHGDLRANNIIVSNNRVCLLDFDWSGIENVTKYPGFMNHSDIDWADGASDGLVLHRNHDLYMLSKLIQQP